MVRILAFTDPHGDLGIADALLRLAGAESPDVIVCSGDFSFLGGGYEAFLDRLRALDRTVYFVPGNHELPETCRAIEAAFPRFRNVSRAVVDEAGLQILGLPGEEDFAPPGPEPAEAAERALRLWSGLDRSRPVLLLSHYPPAGTACDGLRRRSPDGRVTDLPLGDEGGSRGVRRVAEALKPDLLICGHYHQCFGREDRIGPVRVANPGPAGRMYDLGDARDARARP